MCIPTRTWIRTAEERLAALLGRGDRLARVRERVEERVALGVDLDAVVSRERLAEEPAVLGERLRERLGPELVEKLRRPLDVGEQEGDDPGRKVIHHRRHDARDTNRCISRAPGLGMGFLVS